MQEIRNICAHLHEATGRKIQYVKIVMYY